MFSDTDLFDLRGDRRRWFYVSVISGKDTLGNGIIGFLVFLIQISVVIVLSMGW